jgi:hypothetical protein
MNMYRDINHILKILKKKKNIVKSHISKHEMMVDLNHCPFVEGSSGTVMENCGSTYPSIV